MKKYILLLLFTLALPARGALTLGRTLFIGDSITEASSLRNSNPAGGSLSWRYEFWKMTVDSGVTMQTVGSRTSNYAGNSTYPEYLGMTFDNRHEAIWGTNSLERLGTLSGQFEALNADTAFIMIGSNDIFNSSTMSQIEAAVARQSQMVMGLQQANPDVTISIISILPRYFSGGIPNDRNGNYEITNELLSNMAASMSTGTSNVLFIDAYSLMTPAMLWDGIHPNTLGEQVIAEAVFNAVVPEPSSVLLLGASFVMMGLRRSRC